MSEPGWELLYWTGIKGRGEYVRLVFEEAGVPYVDVAYDAERAAPGSGVQVIVDWVWGGGNPGFPARAPPVVRQGDFVLSGTPVVQAYLGRQFGLMPADPRDAAHVEQLLAVVTDGVAEGRLAFHPKDFYASHKTQVEESKPYIVQYGTQRLPKYMKYFEEVLAKNPHGNGGQGFLVADSMTVADLAVYQFMAAARQHYGSYYEAVDTPLAKAHAERIAARPRIAAYLASERCPPWDTDSMM